MDREERRDWVLVSSGKRTEDRCTDHRKLGGRGQRINGNKFCLKFLQQNLIHYMLIKQTEPTVQAGCYTEQSIFAGEVGELDRGINLTLAFDRLVVNHQDFH